MEVVYEHDKNAETVSEHEKSTEKVSEQVKISSKREEKVHKLSKKEKKTEKVPDKGKEVANVSDNERESCKKSFKEENIEKIHKDENVERVTKKGEDVEELTKKEKDGEKIFNKENNGEEFKGKKNLDKLSKEGSDLAEALQNKKDEEKIFKTESNAKKESEKEMEVEKVFRKHEDNEKELPIQNTVKIISENMKKDSKLPESLLNAQKISKNKKDVEKISEKESTNTVEENKRRLSVGHCETVEELDKLDHKSCSSEKEHIDDKSDRDDTLLPPLTDSKKERCLEKKSDDKNGKPSLKDDTVVKFKSESSNEIDKEKCVESEACFTDKDDKLCSEVDSEGKLDQKDDSKFKAVSEKNLKKPATTCSLTENGSKCLEKKTDEKNEISAEGKDVDMPDISHSSKVLEEFSDTMKSEGNLRVNAEDNSHNEIKVENISKPKKPKGKAGRKASFTRRKNRGKKDTSLKVLNIANSETIPSTKVEKGESVELSVAGSIEESRDSSSKEAKESNLSAVVKSKISYEEQLNIYNLRHSTCLETKLKHPFCDKYLKKTKELKKSHVLSECTIELTNDENLLASFNEVPPANTKTRLRGKNSKQPVSKKPQSVSTPVPKPTPPAKKTLASSAKKRPNRNRKKEESEKDDFAIPEGFLEILGNAEKVASDKGASGKKRKGFELKDLSASQQNSENESAPIKRSRRIQEQHQKKMTELAVEMEREQRILEQLAKRSNNAKKNAKSGSQKPTPKSTAKGSNAKMNVKGTSTPTKSPKARAKIQALAAEEETCMESRRATRKMNSRSKNLTKMTLLYEDESKDSQFSTSRETEKSKRRRRGRGQKKGFRPWDVSSESESSIEELTEEEEEEPEEPLIFDVNEDEFACEEVDPNAEPVVIRRARTAKKVEIENTAEECINDDTPCQKCGKYDKPEWILLCDKCDSGYHTHCLIPPLMIVPDGDWFCQPCEHMSLCQCLQEELNRLEVVLKQREREELRKQRLAYVGISLDNVLKPEKKEKSEESEKEDEEEEEERREEEDHKPPKVREITEDERHQKLYGKRSVRARRNVNYQFKEYDALIASALQEEMIEMPEEDFKEEEDGSEAGSDKPFTAKISKRKKKGRRWKDLEFSDDEEDSEDEYQGGSTDSEATMPPSSNSDQESGSGEWKISKSKKKPQKKPPKSRRRKRGGDSSEEDWEDEFAENDNYRPTTRRAAQKAISYRELSSDEEDEWGAKSQVAKKRRKASSSESEASFKKKQSKKKRICKWASSDSSESEEEKSMSSSDGESEEEGSQEDESGNEWKIDQKEKILRLKSNTNKKVLSSEEDEESSTQDSAPKKQPKKVVSDESEEDDDDDDDDEEEEEEEDDESESEENSEESEEEDEEEIKEKKIQNKPSVPEKKVPPAPISKITIINNSKPDSEKKGIPSEKTESASENKSSIDKHESLSITENREFQPKVLVKKELCSVDIPLEPIKQTVPITPVVDKAPAKTVRKETTKMVPCVIPYDKSPKSGHASNPEEESDKETSKEEEMPHRVPPPRPAHFPKQGTTFTSPSSRIQFGGVLARHSVPPLSSSVRPPVPTSNVPPRMLAPTNLSTRPSTSPSVVVRHTTPPSSLAARPSIPASNMPVSPSTSSTAAPAAKNVHAKSENKSYKSTIMEPFSNMDDENDSDDEVPLERIPNACVPAPLPNRPVSFEREAEYRPAAKELSSYAYAPPEEKPFPGSYSSLAPFQDFSTRPSPLKPSLVETYPNNSSPSKLTPLDTYSQTSSPKGFISLDSYSENRKKKHFYGNTSSEGEPPHRPPPSSSENYQGGEIRFPPEPYPCPQSPNTYPNRSPSPTQRDPGTPPRLYSQFPDAYAPPRSPEYYQNHQYYASEERIPRPSYQPNYAPQEPSFVSNPYVATPVPQPNGGFMIDTLLRARNHENEEDELTGVTDIVSYITQE